MKEGKSITQFSRQTSLTGDELLLVNQIRDDGTCVSRYMSLSGLRDYIIGQRENSTNEGN